MGQLSAKYSQHSTYQHDHISSIRRTRSYRAMAMLRRAAICFAAAFLLLATGRTASAQAAYVYPNIVQVGGTPLTEVITIPLPNGALLSSVQVLTQGVTGGDFSLVNGDTTSGLFLSNSSYSVSIEFTPKYPGARQGAIVLLDALGNVITTQMIYGVGQGPLSVMEAGEVTTIAGNGHLVNDGSGSLSATSTSIHEPLGVAVDGAGNLYYSDSGDSLICEVTVSNGNVVTLAGTGTAGPSGSGITATSAQIDTPSGMVLDGAGNIYFADSGNNQIREIVRASGKIYTIAGNGTMGSSGDGQAATQAELSGPQGLAFDSNGNLYIADTGNNVIREVTVADGKINTVVGTGTPGYTNDGQAPATAELNSPWGVFVALDGSLYIADFSNNVVRKVNAAGTLISTVAGDNSPTPSYAGDGGPAIQAMLNRPTSVVVDAAGNLYISDSENNAIRKVNGTTQNIVTIAGNGQPGYNGDSFNANLSTTTFDKPYDVALDSAGDLFIADRLNLRVREVSGSTARVQYSPIKATNTSAPTPQNFENDGNGGLSVSSIVATSNSAVDPITTTCSNFTSSNPLAVGSSCVIGAEFKPATVGSPVSGVITMNSDSANQPDLIDLVGNSLSLFPTQTVVVGAPNPAALGTPVTFTATVTTAGSSPLSGTVSFYDGSALLGTAQNLNTSSSTATLMTSSLTLGSHSITAVYSGDSGDATSTSLVYTEVIKQADTFVITGAPNPSTVFQPVMFTATITPTNSGGTMPSGDVIFSEDGNLLPGGSIQLNGSGVAIYTADNLTKGTHAITATYGGDTYNLSSNSNSYSQTVNSASSTTGLVTSNANVPVETPVMFTATVTGVQNSTPTGNVIFYSDGTALSGGTIGLNNAGVAVFTTSSLPPGSHLITASYQGDGNYSGSTSSPVTETVAKIGTGTTAIVNSNPGVSGATISFTTTVIATSSTTPNTPLTGTVSLMQGSTLLASTQVTAAGSSPATATATLTYSKFTPGMQNLSIVYSGDSNYNTSNFAVPLQIGIATSGTALVAAPTTVIATRPVLLTATVSGNGGVPAGNVTFYDGSTPLTTVAVNASGVATLTTSTLSVGPHVITASYAGDASDNPSTSNMTTVTVQAATAGVMLTPSQNPIDSGQSFTATATVTGNGATPSGTVTFYDGATLLNTVQLNNGVALYSSTTLTDGAHPLTAKYNGDQNNAVATSSTLNEQVLQTVTLTLASSPNPAIARTNVHFVATITPLQGIQPTGSITFTDGGSVLGTGTIIGTTATFDTTTLAVGPHSITASYAGDSSTEALTSTAYPQTINAAGTTVTIGSSLNPGIFGTPITFTANANSTTGALSGTVIFQDGGANIGQATLTNGVAMFTTGSLSAGTHNIVAAYQGDSNDAAASSAALVETIQLSTTTTLTVNQNPILTLTPFTITATVANANATSATGSVIFSEDGSVVGTVALSGGSATLPLPQLTAGSHSFAVTYGGDALDLGSTSAPFAETVQLRPTTDSLVSSSTSLTGGSQLTLTSIVRWTGTVTPTGTISFYNGTVLLGTVTVDGQATASLTVQLPGTSANISSTYNGDLNYSGSNSAVSDVTINAGATISLSSLPTSVSMQTGQNKTVTLTLASMNNFTDTFELGCLGLPASATCTFSKDSAMVPSGGTQTVTLVIDTGNPLSSGTQAKNESNTHSTVLACMLPGGLFLMFIVLPRKRFQLLRGLLLMLCVAGIGAGLTGCGTTQVNSTKPGTYSFEVSAVGATGVTTYVAIPMTVTQ